MNSNWLTKIRKYQDKLLILPLGKWQYFLPQVALFSLLIWVLWVERTKSHKPPLQRHPEPATKAHLSEDTRSLEPNFFCSNNNALRVNDWLDPDFIRAVNQLKPQKIRFPGGTVANYWDWERGGLLEDFREEGFSRSFSSQHRAHTASKLEDFAKSIKLTDAQPVFVLNMSTSDLESQLEMLYRAEDLGLPIEYIELGNELYLNIPDNRDVFPEPEDYADEAQEWISAIQEEFPAAKIALVGTVPNPEKPQRLQEWNQSLIPETLSEADAIVLHIYGGHGLGKEPSKIPTYPFFNLQDTETILGQPFVRWQAVVDAPQFAILPEDKAIWITEYNLFESIFGDKNRGNKPKIAGSWSHGLYALTMSLLFLSDSRVEFVCNHQTIGGFYFASILQGPNSFVDPVTQLPLTEAFTLSATGRALSMFGDATENMDRAVQIAFDKSYSAVGLNQVEYPTLYGWMFANREQQNSLILNLSNRTRNIDTSSLFDRPIYYETLFGSPRELVTQPDSLQRIIGSSRGTVSLPPYSVTRLTTVNLFEEKIEKHE